MRFVVKKWWPHDKKRPKAIKLSVFFTKFNRYYLFFEIVKVTALLFCLQDSSLLPLATGLDSP